jgi:hypothetical protein
LQQKIESTTTTICEITQKALNNCLMIELKRLFIFEIFSFIKGMKASQTLENGKADVSLLQELHRPLEGSAFNFDF